MSLSKFAKLYRVDDPDNFRIKDWDPGDTNDLDIEKKEAKDLLEEGVKRLSELQERLYAQDRWSVLLIFQAMDAAGQGQRDQARHEGRESAGLRCAFLQAAKSGRT